MIKYILLGFLNYQPLTGYELKQAIDESISHFWHAHHSQIYTMLRQMEGEGLVSSELLQQESLPDRRVYTILPAGQQALKTWLNQTQTEVSQVKEDLLVRIFFSAQRDPQMVLTELRLQCELHQAKLATYHAIREHMTAQAPQMDPSLKRDQQFWRLTLDMGMGYEEMYISWLQSSIEKIETL
jgi:PadR family transcriptional regulator, regulatory protein AphA